MKYVVTVVIVTKEPVDWETIKFSLEDLLGRYGDNYLDTSIESVSVSPGDEQCP